MWSSRSLVDGCLALVCCEYVVQMTELRCQVESNGCYQEGRGITSTSTGPIAQIRVYLESISIGAIIEEGMYVQQLF